MSETKRFHHITLVSAPNTMGVMSPLSVATAILISTLLYLQKTHLSVPLETTSDPSEASFIGIYLHYLSVPLETTSDPSVASFIGIYLHYLSVLLETTSDPSVASFIDIYLHCCACKKNLSVKVLLQTTLDLSVATATLTSTSLSLHGTYTSLP